MVHVLPSVGTRIIIHKLIGLCVKGRLMGEKMARVVEMALNHYQSINQSIQGNTSNNNSEIFHRF